MITHFKIFENLNDHKNKLSYNIRCNWCYAILYDDGQGFEYNEDEDEVCPKCGESGMLMDINPGIVVEKDFEDYVDSNLPKEGINIEDYNDIVKYYQDAYPEYFASKKYNL